MNDQEAALSAHLAGMDIWGRHTYLSFPILPQGNPTFQYAFLTAGFYLIGRQGAKTFVEATANIEQGTPNAQG